MNARVLHVAALPFPSRQGTQALLHAMLDASVVSGRDAQLLTYATRGHELTPRFALHRAPAVGWPSLRSGPSVGKLVADAALALALRRVRARVRPDVVVAHHVEAAALALGMHPLVFFAHTDLAEELPGYLPRLPDAPVAALGASLDGFLVRRADAVAAVSPWLRDALARRAPDGLHVTYVPAPWPLAEPADEALRARARRRLELSATTPALLYAGNLDAYQGWQRLVHALGALPDAVLIVATASDATELRRLARSAGVEARLRVCPLDGELARAELHAAADVVVVVRLARGGVPIKLLDALSRARPCVVTPAAMAGLPLADAVAASIDESSAALVACLRRVIDDADARRRLSIAGPRYLAREHGIDRFLSALDDALAAALARAVKKQVFPPH